ncbi:MAG: patatin-like phospholipase family protein [Cytophagales bacterium]|nr:MAG: patatin-like phospholipase family protein [Cytophagales bacterium]TAF60735.1 MAG: patatin-like phospholipase family protein [Cytophagales bacterium]
MKTINLALQGGGSHGAFTWGVLERFLEDERISFEGICGTSAGAVNAAVLAYGLTSGGRSRAIELLEQLWQRISVAQWFSPLQPSLTDRLIGDGSMKFSPMYHWTEFMLSLFPPHSMNPMNFNPLELILSDMIDFEVLSQCQEIKLFVCATNVKTSRVKVFRTPEITVKTILASACLPTYFQSVQIGEDYYWDGGYAGNPPVFPLIDHTKSPDILVVQIDPIRTETLPLTVDEIRDRINELSFNMSLMYEMRKINFVQKLLDKGINFGDKFRDVYIHHIHPHDYFKGMGTDSKFNADWQYLNRLRNIGRNVADEWINNHFEHIGKQSTCDIAQTFLS